MTTNEMKKTLHQKLIDENCNIKFSDIKFTKDDNEITIVILGFEPFSFKLTFEFDEGDYIIYVSRYYRNEYECLISYEDSKKSYDIKSALIELGYHIGTRF